MKFQEGEGGTLGPAQFNLLVSNLKLHLILLNSKHKQFYQISIKRQDLPTPLLDKKLIAPKLNNLTCSYFASMFIDKFGKATEKILFIS